MLPVIDMRSLFVLSTQSTDNQSLTNDDEIERQPPPASARPRRWRRRLLRGFRITAVALLSIWLVAWWLVLRIVENPSWPPPADAVTASQAQGLAEAFARLDNPGIEDLAIPFAPSTAASVGFYPDGTTFFPAMLADIAAAEHSIHLMMFGMTRGDIARQFVDALIERAIAGVEVRLIVDEYGAKVEGQSQPYFDEMLAAGIVVAVNHEFPLDRDGVLGDHELDLRHDELGNADHRKAMIVDGTTGWVGGGGLQDHFNGGTFHDMFVRVTGDIVLQMQAMFLTGFAALGAPVDGEPGSLAAYFPQPDDPGTIRTTLLQNIPGGFVPGTQASRAIIEASQHRLDIMNPYLTDPGIIDRVIAAAERGVRVRVVVPGVSNNVPADAALRNNYPRLLDAGVEILEYPVVMHAKVTVADDALIVGTINYDAWAMYRNLEVALLFEDGPTADRAVSEMIQPDVEKSTPGEPLSGTTDRIAAWVWDKLVYFL